VIDGVQNGFRRVRVAAENLIVDNRERVREHSDLLGMFHNVFFPHAAHKLPTLDIFHSVHKSVKIVTHTPIIQRLIENFN